MSGKVSQMPDWDPNLYLQFSGQRARPATDLIAQITLENPRRVVDVGCGTGNSTELLHMRWPQAELIGVDNSQEMLAQARAHHPEWHWMDSSVEAWSPNGVFDLVFSNACLHWVPNHGPLFPRLLNYVAPGGALAVQMPNSHHLPAHVLMKEVANDPKAPWATILAGASETYHVQPPSFYYDALRNTASRVNVWQSEYLQIMDGPQAILDWVRSTAMRRYTVPLASDEMRRAFEQRCLERFREAYAADDQGKSLFPYRRIFIIAYR
jgi:trans-aconitate 2-methyltransferase